MKLAEHKKKVILVTGAASGIGKEIVNFLTEKGYFVIGADMDDVGLEKLENENIATELLNTSDPDSIHAAFHSVSQYTEKLDGLVNNAGIFDQMPLVEGDMERFEQLINVNVLGPYRMTKAFFPLLYPSKGRIINMSSETARTVLPFQTYGVSKYMMEAWSNILRMELQLLGMYVILIRPGGHKTPLMQKTIDILDKIPHDSIFRSSLQKIRETGIKKVEAVKHDPKHVAKVVYRALTDKNPNSIYSVHESLLYRMLSLLPGRMKEFLVLNMLK